MSPMPPAPPVRRPILRLAGWIATAAVLVLAGLMLVPTALGYGRYVLVSGSMTGTYDIGSVVYTKDEPVSSLRVGQVITYAPPAGQSPQELVTHRIVSRQVRDGRIVLRTKGDANQSADPWTFTLRDTRQAVVRFGVPHVGYVISAFADRRVRMVVVGVPALLIALFAVVGLFRDAAREAREEAEAKAAGTTSDARDPAAGGAGTTGTAPPATTPDGAVLPGATALPVGAGAPAAALVAGTHVPAVPVTSALALADTTPGVRPAPDVVVPFPPIGTLVPTSAALPGTGAAPVRVPAGDGSTIEPATVVTAARRRRTPHLV